MTQATPLVIDIPGWRRLALTDLVLDFNGTLACDGLMLPGVHERLRALAPLLAIHIVTGDTHGTAAEALAEEPVQFFRLTRSAQGSAKRRYIERIGCAGVAAIGNGRNDVEMLRAATLGIAVIGPEGTAGELLDVVDVVTKNSLDALDLLLGPQRLVATLRT